MHKPSIDTETSFLIMYNTVLSPPINTLVKSGQNQEPASRVYRQVRTKPAFFPKQVCYYIISFPKTYRHHRTVQKLQSRAKLKLISSQSNHSNVHIWCIVNQRDGI